MKAVLGIHVGHDASICLSIDGSIILAIQEERFTRIKNHTGFPFKSLAVIKTYLKDNSINKISLALAQNKLTQDLDISLPVLISRLVRYKYPRIINKLIYIIGKLYDLFLKNSSISEFIWRKALILRISRILERDVIEAGFFDHHKCHAASAAYSSNFKDCVVFTQDGKGDFMSGSAWYFNGGKLKNIYYQKEEDSIGQIYAEVTRFLGFRPNRHEGKVTGLAATGNPKIYKDIFDKLIKLDNKGKIIRSNKLKNYNFQAKFLQKIFANKLDKSSKSNVAAAVQYSIEKIFLDHLNKILNKPSNIALAGGLFANVKINQEIRNSEKCENLYVQPAMADCGLSMGAAQLFNNNKGIKNITQESALLGTSYPKDYILRILNDLKFDFCWHELENDVFFDIASKINKGKIIGLFQGRMEWGPRALSARSILANPKNKEINNELNRRLNRSDFMPFAPVVIEDDMKDLFIDWRENDKTAEYMTSTYNLNTKYQNLISAIVHVDKTARPQIISKTKYPFLYKVLKEIKKLSGIGVAINTSFNLHEEPIVESPNDALVALKKNAVDILYFGSLRVTLKNEKNTQ